MKKMTGKISRKGLRRTLAVLLSASLAAGTVWAPAAISADDIYFEDASSENGLIADGEGAADFMSDESVFMENSDVWTDDAGVWVDGEGSDDAGVWVDGEGSDDAGVWADEEGSDGGIIFDDDTDAYFEEDFDGDALVGDDYWEDADITDSGAEDIAEDEAAQSDGGSEFADDLFFDTESEVEFFGVDSEPEDMALVGASEGLNVDVHTEDEIRAFVKNHPAPYLTNEYTDSPSAAAPYATGRLTDETQNYGMNALNIIRYIAGIPADVEPDERYITLAQAAALVNAANNTLSHYPERPEGMSDELYELGRQGASSCNIASGSASIASAVVHMWMSDGDASNIDRVGHRRWFLNPAMKKTGFGAVGRYSAAYSFDNSRTGANYSGVAWPAQNTPIEFFNAADPWSVSFGKTVTAANVQVTLTRQGDGKTWSFSQQAADGYFNVNNDGYGQSGCVIFRADGLSVSAGESYDVSITGVSDVPVEYTVNIFSICGGNHDYELAYETDPTCTGSGSRDYACRNCGHVRTENISPLGHAFSKLKEENGILTMKCSVCGEEQTGAVPASFMPYWKSGSDPSGNYGGLPLIEQGGSVICWPYTFTWSADSDTHFDEYVVETEDPENCSIQRRTGTSYILTFEKAGNYQITIYPKYNTDLREVCDIKVVKELEGVDLNTDLSSPQSYGTSVKLTAVPDGGKGTLLYTFIQVSAGGEETVLVSESYDDTYTWTPPSAGRWTLYADVKDRGDNDRTLRSGAVNFTVSPADFTKATVTGVAEKTYNGSAQTQLPTVKFGSVTLAAGTDYTVSYSGNVNAGTAMMTLTGKGNYAGTQTIEFTINPASIYGAAVSGLVEKTYTGAAIVQSPVVTLGGKTLAEGTDYTASLSGNVNAGTAQVTVTGKGNYTGTVSSTFKINAASIRSAVISGLTEKTYTGSAITQDPVVKLGSRTLTKGTDYTVSFSGNVNAGTAQVTVIGKGNYKDRATSEFTINPLTIENADVPEIDPVIYSGAAQTPVPAVSVGGTALVKDRDFTVSYAGNTNAGTATVTITGRGNYTGTKAVTFTINPAAIEDAAISGLSAATYTGAAIAQSPVVTLDGRTLMEGTDYTAALSDNINAGTARVTVTGKGNYTGTVSSTFKINAASINTAVISGLADKTYTGAAITQDPVVKLGSRTLNKDTDYTVAFSGNVNAGTATVTVTGKGNYTGTATAAFKIGAASIKTAVVSGLTEKTYTGSAITQDPVVKLGSVTLKKGTDYTVSFTGNTNAGTAAVTVTGKGNYKDTVSSEFTINPLSIENADVPEIGSVVYSGAAHTPVPTVSVGGKALVKDRDFTVSYESNTNAGTATVTITGKDNCTGTVTRTFEIEKAEQTFTAKASASYLIMGQSLTVTADGAVGAVSFKSSNSTIAAVTAEGKVTSKKCGKATITAVAAETENYKETPKTVIVRVYPKPPAQVTAANLAGGIKLTWKRSAGVNGYIIYRNGTKIKTISGGAALTCTDKTATTNAAKYIYKVYARGAAGSSKTCTTVTIFRLSRPALSSVKNIKTRQMKVTWGRNSKASGYEIQYSTSKTFATNNRKVTVSKNATVTKTIGSLVKGKTYYVRIRSYKSASGVKSYSTWSTMRSVKITA